MNKLRYRSAMPSGVLVFSILVLALVACNSAVTPTLSPTLNPTLAPTTPTSPPLASPTFTLTPLTVTPPTPVLRLFETPRDGPAPVVNAIKSATKTVDVEVYELADSTVINALIAAQKAGKAVRVILNLNFPSGGNQNAATYKQLQAAGIAVHYANPAYRYTHEKSIIVDAGLASQQALIMTLNLAPGYLGEPDPQGQSLNFGIIDSNAADVAQIQAIFNADWNSTPYTTPPTNGLVVSPINARAALLQQINGATKSLHIFAQEFEDTQIVNATVAAAKRGVEVKGLLANNISGNTPNAKKVQAAGGQMRFLTVPYQHAKATITDAARVYIGSVNYTSNSLDNNRELGIITPQSDIAAQMEIEFAKFWAQGTNVP